jgi:hypothetical protein
LRNRTTVFAHSGGAKLADRRINLAITSAFSAGRFASYQITPVKPYWQVAKFAEETTPVSPNCDATFHSSILRNGSMSFHAAVSWDYKWQSA